MDNNLNPNWVQHFDICHDFFHDKQLKFEVMDEDDSNNHDLIGNTETSLTEILLCPKQTFKKNLVAGKKKNRGLLTVRADKVYDCVDEAKLAFTGNIVTSKVLCYGSDNPYILIERARTLEL